MPEPTPKKSLADVYAERDAERKRCSVATLLASLDEHDAALLAGWLMEGMTHYEIARLLHSAGYRIHRNTIADHRNGVCACR